MTAKEAANNLRKIHNKLTVTSCKDYDSNYYIFTALEDPNEIDYNCPMYAVNKRTGKVTYFTPMEDLDKFLDAKYVEFK